MIRSQPIRKSRKRWHVLDAPWWIFAGLGMLGTAFFWVLYPSIHVPHYQEFRAAWLLDRAIHSPGFINWAGILSAMAGLAAAVVSMHREHEREQWYFRQRSVDALRQMSWQEFERVVGEFFRRQGYQVDETGLGGADGGVDLLIRRAGEATIVQCKQWKSTGVGAPVVREMYGLMIHHGASRVAVVCLGKFTKEARAFAQGKPIDLINGQDFVRLMHAGA